MDEDFTNPACIIKLWLDVVVYMFGLAFAVIDAIAQICCIVVRHIVLIVKDR